MRDLADPYKMGLGVVAGGCGGCCGFGVCDLITGDVFAVWCSPEGCRTRSCVEQLSQVVNHRGPPFIRLTQRVAVDVDCKGIVGVVDSGPFQFTEGKTSMDLLSFLCIL